MNCFKYIRSWSQFNSEFGTGISIGVFTIFLAYLLFRSGLQFFFHLYLYISEKIL